MTDIILSKAYKLAMRLKELAPWNYLYESDLFGVQMPDNGKPYFISIMGSGGEHYAISAYEDVTGLMGFSELQQPAKWLRPLEMMLVPHLMVSFENRDMIAPKDRKKMKELGLVFRGQNAWPDLKQTIPGFVPSMPDNDALNNLIIIMEQAINVLERAKTDKEFISPGNMSDNVFLMRKISDLGQWEDTRWTFEPPTMNYPMIYDIRERDKILSLPQSSNILQADIAVLSSQVAEPGEKAFFASTFVVMDKQSGMALNFETLSPLKGINEMHSNFPNLLIKTILKLNQKPAAIEIRHPKFFQMTKKVFDPVNVKIIHKPVIKSIDKLLEMFESSF